MTNEKTPDLRLRREQRLARRNDFQATFDDGFRASGKSLLVVGRVNQLEFSRMGISIGRRYGSAVARNRFKRVCREAFRTSNADSPVGHDWIILPNIGPKRKSTAVRVKPAQPRLDEFRKEFIELTNQIARRTARAARKH